MLIVFDLKKALFENYWSYFAAARAKRAELAANPDYVKSVLRDGADRARKVASVVLKRACEAPPEERRGAACMGSLRI